MAKMIVPQPIRNALHAPLKKIPINLDSIEAMTPETDSMVNGTFVNVECPGQPAKVCGKFYKGMQYFEKTFEDNEVATIPKSVARFINERCKLDQHHYILDAQGAPTKASRGISRYKFMANF